MIRRLVPRLLVPLCVLASLLATAPWLRAFPANVGAVPLLGAAVLSVLVPAVTVHLRWRLRLGTLVDVLAFVLYTLLVVLRDPTGVGGLVDGLYRGPSQILTFALPLVSPRELMVAPVALIWLAGALAGECVSRRWSSVLPYFGLLVAFGLAYAGTQRASATDAGEAQLRETVLGAMLLAALLLLRTAQAWVRQDETAESTQPDGVLPLRGVLVGTTTALVVALAASVVVQAGAFPKRATTPQRVPSVARSRPLGPVSFVAALRPRNAKIAPRQVFEVTLDRAAPGYFGIANVNLYDGAGWSFQRTFRPSGGVLPGDLDAALDITGPAITQSYRIASGPLSSAPWMPALYRARKVTGKSVDIDAGSGMIVPAGPLPAGARYVVTSGVAQQVFARLRAGRSTADTAAPATDSQIPGALRTTLDRMIKSFVLETGVPSTPALPFLQALQRDLRTNYALSGAARGSATSTRSASSGLVSPPAARAADDRAGGTGFADVLGSILGQRSGTPEQFATLVALVARSLGVPARVVTGFRARTGGAVRLPAGTHTLGTADAWTWAELPIVGAGWVVLDAAPGGYSGSGPPVESAGAPSPSSSPPPSRNVQITGANGGHAVARKSIVPGSATSSEQGLLVALLIAAGVLVLALLLVLASRKRIRASKRRRAKDPRAQLLGAWQESIDMLTESGLPELSSRTSAEIAELTREQFGAVPGDQAAALGRRANSVAYSARRVVSRDDVDAAWEAQRALRSGIRRQLGLRDRVAAVVRYHRPRVRAVPVGPRSWSDTAAVARSGRPGRPTERRYRGRRQR